MLHLQENHLIQDYILISKPGIDGAAREPVLVRNMDYIVEKTYQLASYLGHFGAYLNCLDFFQAFFEQIG